MSDVALQYVQLHLKLCELTFRPSTLVLADGQNDGNGGQQRATAAGRNDDDQPLCSATWRIGAELLVLEPTEIELEIADENLAERTSRDQSDKSKAFETFGIVSFNAGVYHDKVFQR